MKKLFFYICCIALFVLTVIIAIYLIKGNDPIALLEILITSYLIFVLIFVRWIMRTRYLYNKMEGHTLAMVLLSQARSSLQRILTKEIEEGTAMLKCLYSDISPKLISLNSNLSSDSKSLNDEETKARLIEIEQLILKIVILKIKLKRSEILELPVWFDLAFYKSYYTYQKMDILYHYKVS